MKSGIPFLCVVAVLLMQAAAAQSSESQLRFPKTVEAGAPFSVPTAGSGEAVLYIVGPGDAIQRKVKLGESVNFGVDDLHNAGQYIAVLTTGSSAQTTQFSVVASRKASSVSFLAKPSRLPVNLPNAISGVAYVFDVFGNLILQPQEVAFKLSDASGGTQSRSATSQNGVAWVKMNSGAKAGPAHFEATLAGIHEDRVIQQVPGDPCAIRMSAHPSKGERVALQTEPVRDCNGNPVPDGTIVTFTENYAGHQSTVDVPLKRGVAQTELPAQQGAVISAAAGVVLGNEIRWSGR
jgi:hypothetical protein